APFTTISQLKIEATDIVKSIACIKQARMIMVQGAAMVSLPGIAAKLFDTLAKARVNILFISQASSENNITLVVAENDGDLAVETLKGSKFFERNGEIHWIDIMDESVSLIAVVGHGMAARSGIAGMVFTALGDAKVNVRAIAQGSNELNISIIVKPDDATSAVRAIHEKFKLHGA
ncbi:MAG: ACT domain-containing protein, partial [Promethearchaeota archaeon]